MLIGRYTAVLDACVLHPAFLQGALLWLATERLYRPVWSDVILDEWQRSLEKRFGEGDSKVLTKRAQMEDACQTASKRDPRSASKRDPLAEGVGRSSGALFALLAA